MKRILLVVVVILVAWLGSLFYLGSPAAGEVVMVTTTDASGAKHQTPLWIVDRDGQPWLRAGNAASGWVERVRANPRVEIERNGSTSAYRATPAPEATAEIDALVRAKYGAKDVLVGWLMPGSRKSTLALRLEPVAP
ncbi:MAG TPA: nitroreductase/quinone reductase family protein [Myxococcota bacterium]|nr:nitroreductase/quinone reductase family protein [Myxococcota bacterium]